MITKIELSGVAVEIIKKNIKNLHLSVYPPVGCVRVTAPLWMQHDALRSFIVSKLGWIKRQQNKLQKQERESPREYLDRESHYVWGKRYLLKVLENDQLPAVELKHNQMCLRIHPGASGEQKQTIVETWYRAQLKEVVPSLVAKWEAFIGVKAGRIFRQRMKTKWGGCNCDSKNIRLNTELAKKPLEYLEYILVHEMVHLLEPTHNHRFIILMDQFMPKWRFYREELNRLPVRHERWKY